MKIKLFILAILILGFFSCHRKSTNINKKELKEIIEGIDKIIEKGDTSYFTESTKLALDTSNYYLLSDWEQTYDTSDVIVRYIFNWEEGEIETVTGKIIYTRHPRFWYNPEGLPSDAKFFKVSNGIWIPVDWPKDIINIYIRPKE